MFYNRNDLKKIANKLKNNLSKIDKIDDDKVYELSENLNLKCESYEDNYWYLYINKEDFVFDGRISLNDIFDKGDKNDRQLMVWFEGKRFVKEGIFFTISNDKERIIHCYVKVDVWFKYPVYNDIMEILLFKLEF